MARGVALFQASPKLRRSLTPSKDMASPSVPIVDMWGQAPLIKPFLEAVPEVARLAEVSTAARENLSADWSPARLLALMDEAKIETMVLTAWCRPGGKWAITNERVREFVQFNPKRFIGTQPPQPPPPGPDPTPSICRLVDFLSLSLPLLVLLFHCQYPSRQSLLPYRSISLVLRPVAKTDVRFFFRSIPDG